MPVSPEPIGWKVMFWDDGTMLLEPLDDHIEPMMLRFDKNDAISLLFLMLQQYGPALIGNNEQGRRLGLELLAIIEKHRGR